METLVGGIILVVTEKDEFDNRNKTKMLNSSLNFWLSGYNGRKTNAGFSNESSSTFVKVLIETLMEQIKPIVVGK